MFIWSKAFYSSQVWVLGEAHDWSRPPWPGAIVTICMSCFMTGDPETNKPPATGRVGERLRRHHVSDHLPESFSLASILAEPGVHHQEGLWVRWLAKDNPETNPITIKPETASHVTELFSWAPLPYCSPPGCPFPIKSLALSAQVSPWTIHFWMLDQSPVSGPGRGSPSCNNSS